MTFPLRLLLLASVALTALADWTAYLEERRVYEGKQEIIADKLFSIFKNYAVTRNDGDLRAIQNYTGSDPSFCTSHGECIKVNGEMVYGKMKRVSCGHMENAVIPFFVRENNVVDIINKLHYQHDDNLHKQSWELVQNYTEKRMICNVNYRFTKKDGDAVLTRIDLLCDKCSFEAIKFETIGIPVKSFPYLYRNIQQYVHKKDYSLDSMKKILQEFTVQPNGKRQYDIEVSCFNMTSGRKYVERRVDDESTPIEKVLLPAFLTSQNVNTVKEKSFSTSNYWDKVDDNTTIVKGHWIVGRMNDRYIDCYPQFIFNTTVPSAITLTKLIFECDFCLE